MGNRQTKDYLNDRFHKIEIIKRCNQCKKSFVTYNNLNNLCKECRRIHISNDLNKIIWK